MLPNIANSYLPGVITIPSALSITAITNAYPAVATVTANAETQSNSFIAGQLVTLQIPVTYGMWQANNQTVKILANDGSNISLDMDSTNYDAFSIPNPATQPATMSPSGSRNLTLDNETRTEPFQSLNNRGN